MTKNPFILLRYRIVWVLKTAGFEASLPLCKIHLAEIMHYHESLLLLGLLLLRFRLLMLLLL